MLIRTGQKWRTYSGETITIREHRNDKWVGLCMRTGEQWEYSESGGCYKDGFSGMDLELLMDDPASHEADSLAAETLTALGWHFDGQCWVQDEADEPAKIDPEVVKHPLYPVFVAAIEQAMYGKGQRHGGNVTPFLDQPWVHYVKMHGRGFATGQAAKKLEEAASLRSGEPFIAETLGAIVYCGMSVLKEQGRL